MSQYTENSTQSDDINQILYIIYNTIKYLVNLIPIFKWNIPIENS